MQNSMRTQTQTARQKQQHLELNNHAGVVSLSFLKTDLNLISPEKWWKNLRLTALKRKIITLKNAGFQKCTVSLCE